MQLEHSFTVPVGIDDAWPVLLDIESIAPCMPGAAIDSVDGDNFTGIVKVKLGPIAITYKGKASFLEKDKAAYRAVIDARGREARGSGTATAKVTATLTESGASTRVNVVTDLDITGKPAQFGRGVLEEVGNKLIGQFADCLAGKLTDSRAPAAQAAPVAEPPATPVPKSQPLPRPRKPAAAAATLSETEAPAAPEPVAVATAAVPRAVAREVRRTAAEVEPINVIETAGPAIAKRLLPLIAALVVIVLALRHRRR